MKERLVADLVYERPDKIAEYLKGVYSASYSIFDLKILTASLAMADTVAACELLENKGVNYRDEIHKTVLKIMNEPDPTKKRKYN